MRLLRAPGVRRLTLQCSADRWQPTSAIHGDQRFARTLGKPGPANDGTPRAEFHCLSHLVCKRTRATFDDRDPRFVLTWAPEVGICAQVWTSIVWRVALHSLVVGK